LSTLKNVGQVILKVAKPKKGKNMTYNHNFTLPEEILEQISEQGFDYLPELLRIMINAAMQVERQKPR
jgi:hypothetical protein